ncbi:hypothetical protein J4526_05450 [Desulfurococcaceae archaeon MEX13E-LK6-19]|nr:hypothetical protein J4526_05450 [Desulfurococcaceae archaeon MEX13E-LK6-19]
MRGKYDKEQIIFEDNITKTIAFYSRLVNFIEDVIDDAYCTTVYINELDSNMPWTTEIVIEPINCKYDPYESVRIFSEEWSIDNVVIGRGIYEYGKLYEIIARKYIESLHYTMKSYASRTLLTKREYYLAISFYGKAAIVEGDPERVRIPAVNQCFSAHTHPATRAFPSIQDMITIFSIMLNRGIGHAIETVGDTMLFYRTAPLTEDDIAILRKIEREHNAGRAFELMKSIPRIKVIYMR